MIKHDSDNPLPINAKDGTSSETGERIPSVPAEVLKLSESHYPLNPFPVR